MTKAQLLKIADNLGISVNSGTNKAEIINTILAVM